MEYFSHPSSLLHKNGAQHPEQPARVNAIENAIAEQAFAADIHTHVAQPSTLEVAALGHSSAYLAQLQEFSPTEGYCELDGDTTMNPHSLGAALHGLGASLQALDLLAQGEAKQAFVATRPPGHHAERNKAMGFCLLGHVGLSAIAAVQKYGYRVAIVDFDVHHGNGTEDLVAEHEDIFFCSSFQFPLYPGYYAEDREGQVLNRTLSGGGDGAKMRQVYRQTILPAVADFAPDLILVSAGFDAHKDDPLGGLNWQESDYTWLADALADCAAHSASGRMLSVLEGGYNLDALGRSVCAYLQPLVTIK